MTVRSKSLALGQMAAAGPTTVYTVPTGYRTIIKSLSGQNRSAASANLTVDIKRSGTAYNLTTFAAIASGGNYDWNDRWLVLNAGDELRLSTGAASPYFTYFLSGAELLLP